MVFSQFCKNVWSFQGLFIVWNREKTLKRPVIFLQVWKDLEETVIWLDLFQNREQTEMTIFTKYQLLSFYP